MFQRKSGLLVFQMVLFCLPPQLLGAASRIVISKPNSSVVVSHDILGGEIVCAA